MSKIKISIPTPLRFQCEIPLRNSDINCMGHLDSAAVIGIAMEARLLFFRTLGQPLNGRNEERVKSIEEIVEYIGEAFYGETLVVNMDIAEKRQSEFEIYWHMTEANSKRSVAKGITTVTVFIDPAIKR